jgi:hypothetical protein
MKKILETVGNMLQGIGTVVATLATVSVLLLGVTFVSMEAKAEGSAMEATHALVHKLTNTTVEAELLKKSDARVQQLTLRNAELEKELAWKNRPVKQKMKDWWNSQLPKRMQNRG